MMPIRVALPQNANIKISGYVDAYYARNSQEDIDGTVIWPAIGARSATMGLNIAQITADAVSTNVRGRITLQFGDLPEYTFRNRYQMIQEGYVGLKLQNKLWVDFGVFTPHFGVESFLPKDNHLSLLSLPTYFEPFVQAGSRLVWKPVNRWKFAFHLLNGFGTIDSPNKNPSPALEVEYSTYNHFRAGYNNQLAQRNDHQTLFYHNLWLKYFTSRSQIRTAVSFGSETNSALIEQTNSGFTYNGLVSYQYFVRQKWTVAARIEYTNDQDALLDSPVVIDGSNTLSGPEILGGSLGFTYIPFLNSYFRLEGRYLRALQSDQKVFSNSWLGTNSTNALDRTEVLATVGVKFGGN